MHPLAGGLQLLQCPLEICSSLQQIQNKLRDHISLQNHSEWIFASGYIDPQFPNGQAHKKYLDEVCPDKPLAMMRFDCHAYLVNTKALEKAGITKDTPNHPTGIIEKDAEGELTGVLHEGAMDLIKAILPKRKPEEFKEGFDIATNLMLKEGITGCMDASVKSYRFKAYSEIYSQADEKLPRTSLSLYWGEDLQKRIDEAEDKNNISLAKLSGIPELERLRIRTVKFFLDGVLESQTALLEEPYLGIDKVVYHGIQNFGEEHLKKYVAILHANGIQSHFHTVGDKAVRIALDAIEYAKTQHPGSEETDPRHYLAHLQLVNKNDYERFKRLNVCGNFSPVWCWYDSNVKVTDTYLGPERAKTQYPIGDLMRAGITVTFGSDWPVSSHRPLDGIETAVTRKEVGDSGKGEGWCKDQSLSVEEAILAYTINSAYTLHLEKVTGSLEVGKKADIIVLNQDIFKCETWKISDTRVRVTILDGNVVYNGSDEIRFERVLEKKGHGGSNGDCCC